MTCLTIVQNAYQRIGLTKPAAVASSSDLQALQMLALLNEEGQSLSERTDWQALTVETSFVTVAAEIQTTLDVTCPGMKFIINQTIWNRTLRRPVFGPLGPQIWQQQKAFYFTGPWNQYRVVDNAIKFIPIPPAGQDCFFEYVTANWCQNAGGTGQTEFLADSDTARLDENLLTLGLIWRWKQQKGFDFETDYKKYEQQVQNALGRDASKAVLNLGDVFTDIPAVVVVPSGSWPV